MTVGLPKTGMVNNIQRLWIADIGILIGVYQQVGVIVPDIFKDQELVELK